MELQLNEPQVETAKADNGTSLKLAVAGNGDIEDLEDGDEIADFKQSTVLRFLQRRTSGAATIQVEGETYHFLALEA